MKRHVKGEAFSFKLPTLARTTYKKLMEICEATPLTQWDVVTLGIHLVWKQWNDKNPELKAIREETKLLSPNSGRVKPDSEHERQTQEENGEDFPL